jgi:hypothetical protein
LGYRKYIEIEMSCLQQKIAQNYSVEISSVCSKKGIAGRLFSLWGHKEADLVSLWGESISIQV